MFLSEYEINQRAVSFMPGVYGWMSSALAVTAGTAYYVAMTPSLFTFVHQPGVIIGLIIAQLFFVLGLTFLINRMSFFMALTAFLLYSCSLGITLSSIFYVYTQASIVSTFLSTAAMFGCMAVYGYYTRSDLTAMGSMSLMFLWGLIVGMVINMFLASSQLDYFLSAVGVVIFVLLTAYDVQKIKQLAKTVVTNEEGMQKLSLIGALMLYLDFINLFLFLLRFMGKKNEQ